MQRRVFLIFLRPTQRRDVCSLGVHIVSDMRYRTWWGSTACGSHPTADLCACYQEDKGPLGQSMGRFGYSLADVVGVRVVSEPHEVLEMMDLVA